MLNAVTVSSYIRSIEKNMDVVNSAEVTITLKMTGKWKMLEKSMLKRTRLQWSHVYFVVLLKDSRNIFPLFSYLSQLMVQTMLAGLKKIFFKRKDCLRLLCADAPPNEHIQSGVHRLQECLTKLNEKRRSKDCSNFT